jgi:hypothetical protein
MTQQPASASGATPSFRRQVLAAFPIALGVVVLGVAIVLGVDVLHSWRPSISPMPFGYAILLGLIAGAAVFLTRLLGVFAKWIRTGESGFGG